MTDALKSFALGAVTLIVGGSLLGGIIWLIVHHPVPFGWVAVSAFFIVMCLVTGDSMRTGR